MPELRTDDGPRKLRAVWLGPKGAALPFEWTYVQWSVTLLMIPVGIAAVALTIAVVGWASLGYAPWFTFWFGLIYGAPLAVYLSVRLMRGVTFDEPLRYKTATFREELGRQQRVAAEGVMEWSMPWPKLAELPAATEQLLTANATADEQEKDS